MTNNSSTNQPTRDLHGPVTNIQGFAVEAASAADRIGQLLSAHENELPPEFASALTLILSEDLLPCHQFLDTAIAVLEHRLRRLDIAAAVAQCSDGVTRQ